MGQSIECLAPKNLLRSLRLLAKESAVQVVDRPLQSLLPLIADGYAENTHRWNEVVNGKTWQCEKVSITADGRAFLARLESK